MMIMVALNEKITALTAMLGKRKKPSKLPSDGEEAHYTADLPTLSTTEHDILDRLMNEHLKI